jgi:GNAT superfamily N-acetyltransferase
MVNITDIDGKVTKSALDALEVHIDNVFNKLGIDVGFTHHFLDRVNDERNGKQITIRELGRLFAKEYKRWGKPIAQMGPDKEAIMKDLESDVNIPFVLNWNRKTNQLDLVAKTVMRKKNFKSPDREFPVESVDQVRGSEPLPKNSKPSRTGSQPHPYKGRLVGEAELSEDLGSIPPLTDLIVMAVVGQTTVATLKAAFKTGKNLFKLKKLADRAGVKLADKMMGESNPFTDARMNAIKAGKKEFTVKGKTYSITGDTSDEEEAITNEAISRDELQAKLAAKASQNFYDSALQALHRLVTSDPRKQSIGGYAFDIARAFQGLNGRQLERMYKERYGIKEDRITQVGVESDWNPGNIGKDLLMYSGVSLIGTLGPINLYQKKIGVMNRSIFITTEQLSKESSDPVIIEGELLLTQNYTEDSVTLWQVKGAALGKALRGKKLMPKIYAYLVKKGFFLRSDTDQSKGGMKIWAELAKIPGITVYAAKEDAHGNMDYTAVDGDEVLAGDFPIYRNEGVDEYTNEIKAARSQYNVLLAQSEKVSDPKQLEKMQSDLDFLDNHIRKLTKERDEIYNDDRLSRQKNELIYLLATTDKKPKNESINEVSSVDLPKSWGWIGNTDWEGKNTKYVRKIGRLGGYDVVLEQYGANSRKVFLVTDKNENSALDRKPISLIEFERDYGNREGMEYWIAKATIIHPSWQGKGIAPKLYAFLCKKGWVIRSDDLQSQGGKKIWIALSKIPGITVYAAKNDGGNWELSDIDNDVDDFLRSGFHTYDTELKNEVKEIERELAFVEDKIREVWDDYSSMDKTDTANLARLKKEYADLRTMEKKLRDEKMDAQSKQTWDEEHEDVYLFAHAAHDPMYDKPKVTKTESVKKNEKMTENTGNIKINPVSVSDHYKGETFGTKYLMVDGVVKAGVDVSIVDDEVYISHVITADDSRRKGYAKMLVDDLFKEFPSKKISVSNMTDDGSAFFRSQYSVDDETGEIQKKLGEEIETVKVSKDWKSYMWGFPIKKYYSRFTEVEPMGKFRVFIAKEGRELNALLCDKETNMHALVHMTRSSSKSPCVIHAAALDPALQGKGLMPKFYAHLVTKVGLFLQADSMQSAGGRKIWVALSKDPSVTVFAAYKENGVEKYSHVEGDNLLYSDAPIYDDERDENVAEIKNEINSIQNMIDDYTTKLRAEVNRADPNEEKIKELQSHIRELTPKKEELRKEYLAVLPKKPKKTFSKLLAVPAKTPTPESVNETIKKVKGGFQLRSKDGKKNLGTYPTKAGALKRERQVQYFKHMNESYKLQLERDDDLYVLHILNTDSGKRTEVRGKANYETNGYDANDKLHQLLDTIGKTANISELMNGEVVTINPKHPQGEIAKKATDVAFNEDAVEDDPTGYQHDLLTMPQNTLVIDTKGDFDWYKLGQHFARLNQQDPHEFGQSDSDMVVTLANQEQVARLKRILDKFGAEYKEIGGSPEHPEVHSEGELNELKIVKPHPADTLGVPRRHMPQIDEKHYEDLFRYIYDNGGKIKKEIVDPADLMSTQSEFSDKGVEAAMTNGKMNKPIIISSDNYVLDGHHRWLAAKNAKIHKITAFRMSLPAKEGLSMLINFPQTTFKDIHETGGVGKIVKGVNTTIDVGPNEIKKQAAKFGNKVSKDGKPAFNLREMYGDTGRKMLTEAQLHEAMLVSVTKWLGSKAQNTIDDLSATILTMKDAAVLIKDILMDETYFEKSYTQMVKSSRGMLKQLSSVLNTAIGLVNNETVATTLRDMVQNIITFASAIFKRGGIIGFLGSLGVYAFAKYMVQNLSSVKTILANVVKSNFADQFGTFISTVMNVATEKVPGLTFFSFFENLNAVKELFFEVLSSIKRKLEFGRNLNTKAA